MSVTGNDKSSFEKVYIEVFPVLIKVAYHITLDADSAEDLCQEAFIRFYNRTVPFASIAESKYWLIRVVKNLCFNYVKRKGRELAAIKKMERIPHRIQDSGEVELLKSETLAMVQEALRTLPEKLRTVIILKEYGNLNYQEIGKILRISEGNVKVRVHRARAQLERMIDEGEVYVS